MATRNDQPVDHHEGSEVISVEDVARVLAWADGCSFTEIAAASTVVHWLDHAQQCIEDITEATS